MSYTEEQTQRAVELYEANPSKDTVQLIAESLGKTPRSVIAKLSQEGVYKTPQRKTKTGDPIVKKEELAEQIGEILGIEVPTLAKSGKQDLWKLRKALDDYQCRQEQE